MTQENNGKYDQDDHKSNTNDQKINSEGTDFGPFVSNNKIYFTSNREYDLFNIGENNWKTHEEIAPPRRGRCRRHSALVDVGCCWTSRCIHRQHLV